MNCLAHALFVLYSGGRKDRGSPKSMAYLTRAYCWDSFSLDSYIYSFCSLAEHPHQSYI